MMDLPAKIIHKTSQRLYCKIRRGGMKSFLVFIVSLGLIFIWSENSLQSSSLYKYYNVKPVSNITVEEDLIHLAVKLSQASRDSTSSFDSSAVNSAYREVIELVDTLIDRRSKLISCVDDATGHHCVEDVTIVASFVHSPNAGSDVVNKFIESVHALYRDVRIIVAVNHAMQPSPKKYVGVVTKSFHVRTKETDVWKSLFSKVSTEYVYVARDIVEFSNYTRLEYLLDSLTSTVAMAVSSSSKELHTGEWSDGCYQTLFQNYELKYRKGYHVSLKSCLVCQHLSTPFLTYTKLVVKKKPFQKGMTATSGFSIWFLDLFKAQRIVLSCPSSMAHVSNNAELSAQRNQWLDLVKHHQIEKIYLPEGADLRYNCDEASTECVSRHSPGTARSQCCLNQLVEGVQTVMRECEQAGLFCQITDGTVLGVLKFESALPWEVDADLEIETSNATEFESIVSPSLRKLGYKMSAHKGFHTFTSSAGWTIEAFHIGSLGSTRLAASGLSTTHALLNGQYISTSENPGLLGRNRYGHEIYQHANHWAKQGAANSWAFYKVGKFARCNRAGHQACLDQFRADGSIQFTLASH